MLLADCYCSSSIQSFNLFAICGLQRVKDPNVTGWSLWEVCDGMRQRIIWFFKAILQSFELFVCPETVTNENLWFLISLRFDLGIKHKFEPF